jgi:DNA polymerase III subunit delta'
MFFDRIVGQERVKRLLASSLENGRLAHAYLFEGPSGVGKDAMAVSMAMGLNCGKRIPGGCGECVTCRRLLRLEEPAFFWIQPLPIRPKSMKEDKYLELVRERNLSRVNEPYRPPESVEEITKLPIIGVEAIRSLKQETRLKLTGEGRRAIVISHADRMNLEAANTLLKLLEEPPEGTLMILTSAIPALLLPTIRSRCQCVPFDMLSEDVVSEALVRNWNFPEERARFFARMSGGSLEQALMLSQEGFDEKRDAAFDLLDLILETDPTAVFDGIETFQKDRDRTAVREILQVLLSILRDLVLLRAGVKDRFMHNDRVERLEQFGRLHPEHAWENTAENVGRAIAFIEKNVYLSLALITLNPQFEPH